MTDIYIVRHGNTFDKGDTVTRVGARTDLPLSSSGEAQAEALGAYFRQECPEGFILAYCSPLQRTRQTAEIILKYQKNRVTLEPPLEFLREIDYGPDENQPEESVVERIGRQALNLWDQYAVAPHGWQVDPAQLKLEWKNLFVSLGFDRQAGPVLIVTSNGIARFALDAVTNFEVEADSMKLKTGAFGLLRSDPDSIILERWNVRP